MDDDPTLPPPEQQWPSDPPPTVAEDQAVLGLAVHEDTPPLTSDLMLDTLSAWHLLSPLPELVAEPKAGPDCDRTHVLTQITDRLADDLRNERDETTRSLLWAVAQRLRLVWRSLDDPERAEHERVRQYPVPAWLVALQVTETDAAVDAAQAAVMRERRER